MGYVQRGMRRTSRPQDLCLRLGVRQQGGPVSFGPQARALGTQVPGEC